MLNSYRIILLADDSAHFLIKESLETVFSINHLTGRTKHFPLRIFLPVYTNCRCALAKAQPARRCADVGPGTVTIPVNASASGRALGTQCL